MSKPGPNQTQAQAQQHAPGGGVDVPFPGERPKSFGINKTQGINSKSPRPEIQDEQFSWLENMMPIADGNLRTLRSNGVAIYTCPTTTTIVYHYQFNIGTAQFSAVFHADGTAVQVDLGSGAQVTISSVPGTFYDGINPPAAAQFGNSGLLIVTTANTPNGYYAWDLSAGGTLYSPGMASPSWLNGGTPTVMPFGLSGTAVEIYQSRVWVMNGIITSFSGPSNGASFAGATGGGTLTSTDSFLKQKFVNLKQSNGFLYLFADSSCNVISNVQTAGSPLQTTFNNQNVDPQVGTAWPGSLQSFSRGLVFANPTGVFVLYGGAAEKVSAELDGIFADAEEAINFTIGVTTPSGAVITLNGIRVYMLLITGVDYLKVVRNFLLMWDGKKWWIGSQDAVLQYISTQEVNSDLSAWGTDGSSIYPLFTRKTTTLNKVIQTKLWKGAGFFIYKQAYRIWMLGQDNAGGTFRLDGTLDAITDQGSVSAPITLQSGFGELIFYNFLGPGNVIQFQNNLLQDLHFTVSSTQIFGQNDNSIGCLLGFTLTSTSIDFTLMELRLGYNDLAPFGG